MSDVPEYPFDLLSLSGEGHHHLKHRPFVRFADSLDDGGKLFDAGEKLRTAINTAIAVGSPILITGESGTGKTTAAYYARHQLGLEKVIHFQAKSDSAAKDLLYNFDSVRYFHAASVARELKQALPPRRKFIAEGPLWQAMISESPRILLIDEIDKTPKDFPNDLLHELDQMEFKVMEMETTKEESNVIRQKDKGLRPIVFITSNSERRLPEPFLRRCVYHHIEFTPELLRRAVARKRDEAFPRLSPGFLELAIERFLATRSQSTGKKPATGECLLWLRVLNLDDRIQKDDAEAKEILQSDPLPYVELLLKDREALGLGS